MRKILSVAFALGCFLGLNTGCSSGKGNPNDRIPDDKPEAYTLALEKAEEFAWGLDSLTSPYYTSSCFDTNDSAYYFIEEDELIKCRLGDSAAQRTGLKVPLTNFQVAGDTIWGVENFKHELCKYVDGQLEESFPIKARARYAPNNVMGFFPILATDSVIITFAYAGGEVSGENSTNRPVFVRFDRKKNTFSEGIGYPEEYHSQNWGGGMMRWVYPAYNMSEGAVVVSFPASHYLEKWDFNGNLLAKAYGGSNSIESVPSVSGFGGVDLSTESTLDYIERTSCYGNVFYDQWRNLYYRIAEHPAGRYPDGRIKKDVSIIILDNDLNKVGESSIPNCGAFYRYSTFVSHKGLMLPKDSTEDVLAYDVYLPVAK